MPKRKNKIVRKLIKFHEDERGLVMNLSNYVTTARAAQMLGVLPTSVNHLIYDGRLEGKKLGRDWLIFVPSIGKYLKTKSSKGKPPSGVPQLQEAV